MNFSSIIKRLRDNPAFKDMIQKAAAPTDAAPSQPKGLKGMIKNIQDSKRGEAKKNVAESTVDSATAMKKGGPVNKMGRAVKRKTADVKGRAMRGK